MSGVLEAALAPYGGVAGARDKIVVALETRVAIENALLELEAAALEAELGLATIKTIDMALAEEAAKMRSHRPEFDYADLPELPFVSSLADELAAIDRDARADRYLARHGIR